MAIDPYNKYAPRANAATGPYPSGSFKNATTPTTEDGTPVDADWYNDYEGFTAALLDEAGITRSGSPDTLTASDRLDALKSIFEASVKNITNTEDIATSDGAGNDYIATRQFSTGNKSGGLFAFQGTDAGEAGNGISERSGALVAYDVNGGIYRQVVTGGSLDARLAGLHAGNNSTDNETAINVLIEIAKSVAPQYDSIALAPGEYDLLDLTNYTGMNIPLVGESGVATLNIESSIKDLSGFNVGTGVRIKYNALSIESEQVGDRESSSILQTLNRKSTKLGDVSKVSFSGGTIAEVNRTTGNLNVGAGAPTLSPDDMLSDGTITASTYGGVFSTISGGIQENEYYEVVFEKVAPFSNLSAGVFAGFHYEANKYIGIRFDGTNTQLAEANAGAETLTNLKRDARTTFGSGDSVSIGFMRLPGDRFAFFVNQLNVATVSFSFSSFTDYVFAGFDDLFSGAAGRGGAYNFYRYENSELVNAPGFGNKTIYTIGDSMTFAGVSTKSWPQFINPALESRSLEDKDMQISDFSTYQGTSATQLAAVVAGSIADDNWVVIMLGNEDCLNAVSLAVFEANVNAIIDEIPAASLEKTVLVIPPFNEDMNASKLARYWGKLRLIAFNRDLKLVDSRSVFTTINNDDSQDQYGLTAKGAAAIGSAIAEGMSDLYNKGVK